MKHLFVLTAPLVFLGLAACDFEGLVVATAEIDCPLPLPIVTDTTLTGTFNGACPYFWQDGDTLRIVRPGVLK